MDIVFGPDITVGKFHYGLLFRDCFSRMTYIYIYISTKKSHFRHWREGSKLLESSKNYVNAAPSNHQDRNALVERQWQMMVAMARNWLALAELPGSFWFYAVKRAAEVCNYFPLQIENGQWTTPLELAHKSKRDLRLLFKMFSLAALRREHQVDTQLNKFDAQSTPMIVVGRCPTSNGLQFYNPRNGTLVSSIDYKLQENVTSGAHFGLKYQPGSFIYRLDESTTIFEPKFALESPVDVHTHSPPSRGTIIGIPTYNTPDLYTVVCPDGSLAEYTSDLLSRASPSPVSSSQSFLPKWIKGGAKATLFLENMSKPRHGTLNLSSRDSSCYFFPGKSTEGVILHDLEANCQGLLDLGQLFRGHAKFKNLYNARTQVSLQNCVLRHVSAHGLRSLIAPQSLKHHHNMEPGDKQIWDDAYNKEYDGLVSLPTWEVVTQEKYRELSKGKRALPTMAIATIKYDSFNKPKPAKYRLVVLGNLDCHTWSKEERRDCGSCSLTVGTTSSHCPCCSPQMRLKEL